MLPLTEPYFGFLHVNATKNPTTIQDFDSMSGKENCKPILPDNITIYVI